MTIKDQRPPWRTGRRKGIFNASEGLEALEAVEGRRLRRKLIIQNG